MFPDIRPPMTKTDWLILEFAEKDKPTISDFMKLRTIGGLYDRLDGYRVEAERMSPSELENEKHRSSRLGLYMTRAGEPHPSRHCDAHAIISGGHGDAVLMRGLLAYFKLRIDDPFNGCWLPRDWEDRKHMPNHLRYAVPHRRIHHRQYYFWMSKYIHVSRIKTQDQLINALRMIRVALQRGAVPPEVMPKTGL